MIATAGSDVVQSGLQFSMTFSNIYGRISAITRRMLSSKCQYPSICDQGYPNGFCYCLKTVLTYHNKSHFDISSHAGSLRTSRAFVVLDAFPAFSETSMPLKKYSILFVCATKVRQSKQQDEDHKRYAAQRYPTHVQSVTYPANTQAKEEAVPAANHDRI
ncbi:hypothetical protein TNCV_2873461 [Trichonephila clavipes]|nr:hypothetical protein TNCV_2873461 [Trichonephila clavipes]